MKSDNVDLQHIHYHSTMSSTPYAASIIFKAENPNAFIIDGVPQTTISTVTLNLTTKQKIMFVRELLGSSYSVVGCEICGKVDALYPTCNCEYPLEEGYGKCEKCKIDVCLECAKKENLVFLVKEGKCGCWNVLCSMCVDEPLGERSADVDALTFECLVEHKHSSG